METLKKILILHTKFITKMSKFGMMWKTIFTNCTQSLKNIGQVVIEIV